MSFLNHMTLEGNTMGVEFTFLNLNKKFIFKEILDNHLDSLQEERIIDG